MKKYFILFLAVIALSCTRKNTIEDNCQNIQNATIISNIPVTIRQTIKFGTQEVGGYRIYSWIGPDNFQDQYPEYTIDDAQLKHEGWYYLGTLFS